MDGKIFVLLIIAMVGIFGIIGKSQKKAEKVAKTDRDNNRQETDNEIAALKKRIEVLERIVTDKSTRLKDEIDGL